MRNINFVGEVQMVSEVCCNCSMLFAIPLDYQTRRRDDHATFYCPSGHPQYYQRPTEATRLKRELERKAQMLEAEQARALTLARDLKATATAHKRMRTRIQNGICPCCNRTFQNLLAHMRTEHADQPTVKTLRESFGMTQLALAKEIGVNPSYLSLIENDKPAPGYAKDRVDKWLEAQGATL